MLVLSRREGESFVLALPDGRRVEVKVFGRKGWKKSEVVLGVEAPRDVHVRRAELAERPAPRERVEP